MSLYHCRQCSIVLEPRSDRTDYTVVCFLMHDCVMTKMAQMQIPDSVYNWINDFFDEHYHCTRYAGQCSTVAEVKARVIQGSGLGPASYLVTAADPQPVTAGNHIFKYADTHTWLFPL